jgi:hypothetical protein
MNSIISFFSRVSCFLCCLMPAINSHAAECFWRGQWIPLQHIQNVTIEGFRDAQLIGRCRLYAPAYCLNGEYINIWAAPNEYPGQYIVHNGDQGPQCTYQTWIMQLQAPTGEYPSP